TGQRTVAGAVAGSARGADDLLSQRLGGLVGQSVDVDAAERARHQRLVGEEPHLVPVGGDTGAHGVGAALLARAVVATGDDDARHEPAQIPLPAAGVGL